MPLDVVMECLSLREQRVSTDLVRDEVEEELHKVTGIEGGGGAYIDKQPCGGYVQTFDKWSCAFAHRNLRWLKEQEDYCTRRSTRPLNRSGRNCTPSYHTPSIMHPHC